MKILVTGAHFTPAQAVIEELIKLKSNASLSENNKIATSSQAPPRNDGNVEIVYVGRKYTREGDKSLSVESQVLPELGVKFIPIVAGRVRRSFDFYTLFALLKIPIGFIQSFYIVLKEQPDVVVSFGGYVGVPVVISAWLLSKPVIVHEQTLVTGLANQVSNIFANKVAVTFNKEYNFSKSKMVLTGNPIREEIIHPKGNLSPELEEVVKVAKKEKLPILYVTGGNQGAHVINETVFKILDELLEKFVVIHQTGDSNFKDFENINEKKSELKHPERYLAQKFVSASDLGLLLSQTSLVISRGGANTLLEMAYLGIPTIIIPLPFSLREEQTKNARFFENVGLGEVLLQSKLNGKSLMDLIDKIQKGYKEYKQKAKSAKEVVVLEAAKKLTQEILILGSQNV